MIETTVADLEQEHAPLERQAFDVIVVVHYLHRPTLPRSARGPASRRTPRLRNVHACAGGARQADQSGLSAGAGRTTAVGAPTRGARLSRRFLRRTSCGVRRCPFRQRQHECGADEHDADRARFKSCVGAVASPSRRVPQRGRRGSDCRIAPNNSALRIYLARHGETPSNAERRVLGQIDQPLNERGRQQAEALRDTLRGIHFDAIYTSPAFARADHRRDRRRRQTRASTWTPFASGIRDAFKAFLPIASRSSRGE